MNLKCTNGDYFRKNTTDLVRLLHMLGFYRRLFSNHHSPTKAAQAHLGGSGVVNGGQVVRD